MLSELFIPSEYIGIGLKKRRNGKKNHEYFEKTKDVPNETEEGE